MSEPVTRLPRPLYRGRDVQQLDSIAIKQFGIDGFKLMYRAGSVAFNAMLERWPQTRLVRVLVGGGNNGGDGYIIAGLACEQNLPCEIIQVVPPDKLKGDAQKAWQWAREKTLKIVDLSEFLARGFEESSTAASSHTLVVDALLGTGLDREVSGPIAQAIQHINNSGLPVVSVDIPSGLDADTGCPLGLAVIADLTVTFIALKQGLLTGYGRDYAGDIVFSNLDLPDEVYGHRDAPAPISQRIDINDATRFLLPRQKSAHKGQHGHVVVVGGDYRFGGAVLLAAEAALRTGAGLVSVITRSVHRPAVLSRRPEIMVLGTEDDTASDDQQHALLASADVIIVGPGLGNGKFAHDLMRRVLAVQRSSHTSLVVDADGLRLLAEDFEQSAITRRDTWILTPHPGEAAQLLGCSVEAVQSDRFAAVQALQEKWGGHCLLKGSGSLLCCKEADLRNVYLSTEGNPGMATAGMGDVLSGITGSLVAQGLTLANSLKCGVVIHGEAADLAAAQDGQRGMQASDIFPFIRQLVNPVQG